MTRAGHFDMRQMRFQAASIVVAECETVHGLVPQLRRGQEVALQSIVGFVSVPIITQIRGIWVRYLSVHLMYEQKAFYSFIY